MFGSSLKRSSLAEEAARHKVTRCKNCQKNCHEPCECGGFVNWLFGFSSYSGCKVIKDNRCTVCPRSCPASDHVTQTRRYQS